MILQRAFPFITHAYDPLYLANGSFGGLQDLSATQMDLWSSSIGSRNLSDMEEQPVLFPVTLLHTGVWYRNAHYRERDIWVGRDGVETQDPRYTASPSMPHLPQVYRCKQSLDLDTGMARCSGELFPGAHAALEAGLTPERVIPYATRTVFLKDSSLMAMEICSDATTEILFAPELCLEERVRLDVSGRGICKIGSEIDCDMHLRKTVLASSEEGHTLHFRLQPEGANPYRIRIDAPGSEGVAMQDRPALCGRGKMTVFVQISAEDADLSAPPDFEDVLAEQASRWGEFWGRSQVNLPASEGRWQERYQASLYYVAQSIGDGPTHPGGLSKPNFPHWFGCFHDTDTYFCRPLLESGRPELPAKHLRFRHRCLPRARVIARASGLTGAQFPWQCDLNGNGETHHLVMNAAIIAREACFQALISGEEEAHHMAVEVVEQTLAYLLGFTVETDGCLSLKAEPLLTFSETVKVSRPNEAVLALRGVATALLELRKDSDLAESARRVLRDLVPELGTDGELRIAPTEDPEYMRCPSVTLGGFPLHVETGAGRMGPSLDRELAKIMFVFAWLPYQLSATAAGIGRREGPTSAAGILRLAEPFIRDWHAVDEWENRRTGRADHFVTAAGGFATAIHHMLLAETAEGVWELFPGTPADWQNVSFEGLVTRNGWRISAELQKGRLIRAHAVPAHQRAVPALTLKCSFEGPARPAPLWTVEP